jgi:tellurite methyltransferase
MATIDEWNERYRADGRELRSPSPVVVRAAALSTPGRALDLACGAGRNALFLAAQGWEVVAIDGADEAIRQLEATAERENLSIDTAVVDLEHESIDYPQGSFDLIVITNYLQRDLFAVAGSLLRSGGRCAAAIHLADDSAGSAARGQRYRLAPNELRRLFDGWEVVDYREENGVAEIIARQDPRTG